MKFFKKLFSRNNNVFKKINEKGLRDMTRKEGFYIIMFLCVCIVATSAVWVAKSNIDRLVKEDVPQDNKLAIEDSDQIIDISEEELDNQMSDVIVIDEDDRPEKEVASNDKVEAEEKEQSEPQPKPEKKPGQTLVKKKPTKPKKAETKLAEKAVEKEAIPVASEKTMAMIWPVKGELGMGYAIETLTYSKTLEHFTTHHGIDVMAEENTPVKAVLDGEVIEVLTDSRLGLTISLKHEDGLITRYSNLCTDAMVKIGDKVSQGQTISGVGTSSIFEAAEEPHLHFEVLKDGSNVNPFDYLAEE